MRTRIFPLLALFAITLTITSCTDSLPDLKAQSTQTHVTSLGNIVTPIIIPTVQTPPAEPTQAQNTPTLPLPTPTFIPTSAASPTTFATNTTIITSARTASTSLPIAATSTSNSSDPDLEPGFPIETGFVGSSQLWPSLIVGNIDADPQMEFLLPILAPPTGRRQLAAFKLDGSFVPGWPVNTTKNPAVSLGNLSGPLSSLEVFAPFSTTVPVTVIPAPDRAPITLDRDFPLLNAHSGDGSSLPGWPVPDNTHLEAMPILVDTNGDGFDEIFAGTRAFNADGSSITGWPSGSISLASGDLDGDKIPDILSFEHDVWLSAHHANGTRLSSFFVTKPFELVPMTRNYVIGDVDGDGLPEVIVSFMNAASANPASPDRFVQILSNKGDVKHTMPLPEGEGGPSGNYAFVLADLDCDSYPEILTQTKNKLFAWKGDGTLLVGWPKDVQTQDLFSPLVGDVDGDGYPDVVTVAINLTSNPMRLELQAYDRHGTMLPRFPKALDTGPAPAIALADVDNDGRTEIIVASTYGRGGPGSRQKDALWVYDLQGTGKYGPVEWGQFDGGPQHQGFYSPSMASCPR